MASAQSQNLKPRILSGMRSTGKLHLGNFVGALDNWVRMQDQYECFFFIADWHALTTDYADTSQVKRNSIEVLLDWLAAGLDREQQRAAELSREGDLSVFDRRRRCRRGKSDRESRRGGEQHHGSSSPDR